MVDASRSRTMYALYGIPFLLAFVLSIVMVTTDKNLQTDFGTLSSGYYFHWYVVLATAVIEVLGAVLLFVVRSRLALKAGIVGSGLLAIIFLGDVFTYTQVGFSSASDFANYLFGVTYSGGDIRYLYDVLVAVYIATFLWGIVTLMRTREAPTVSGASESMPGIGQ